jgi:xanthine dehydrogenase accessory factor
MSFDIDTLSASVAEHDAVARVVITGTLGSTPREVGTAMLVWSEGQSGTIGGGALEFEAVARARQALDKGNDRLDKLPLGPSLGQCCGGVVDILTEIWTRKRLAGIQSDIVVRPLPGGSSDIPLTVRRLLKAARGADAQPQAQCLNSWIIEPVSRPDRHLWLYGAGHVGRAIVDVLAPLPDLAITWVDTDQTRFPDTMPAGVCQLVAKHPSHVVQHAPDDADHLILTYSHSLDLDLCHAVLGHGFRSAGLIGSSTKWARFRSRLRQLGHSDTQISRINCPIGNPDLGKHPQAIAMGVAAGLLRPSGVAAAAKDATG